MCTRYSQEYTVSISNGMIDSDLAPEQHEQLCRLFEAEMNRLPSAELAAALVDYLDKRGATRLRENGGIYWLPASRLPDWQRVALQVEGIANNTIYMISHSLDYASARAVHDAVTAEIADAAAAIMAEISEQDLGPRALEAKEERAKVLLEKAKEYEAILGASLDRTKQLCDEVREAAATARLLAASDDTPLFEGLLHGT